MSSFAAKAPSGWKPFRFLKSIASITRKKPVNTANTDAENQMRRAFILEMMEAHPEAFQHELDIQNMMHFYPSRF
jgi:hypothetical protein